MRLEQVWRIRPFAERSRSLVFCTEKKKKNETTVGFRNLAGF